MSELWKQVKDTEEAWERATEQRDEYQARAARAEQAVKVITAGVKKLEANLDEVLKLKEKDR